MGIFFEDMKLGLVFGLSMQFLHVTNVEAKDCMIPSRGPLKNGKTAKFSSYANKTVPFGSTCRPVVSSISCKNGKLSAWTPSLKPYSTCSVLPKPEAPKNTGSYTVDSHSKNFSRAPAVSSGSDYGSRCHTYSASGMNILSIGLGTPAVAGNYSGMSILIYNYRASTSSYTIAARNVFPGNGGSIVLSPDRNQSYSDSDFSSPGSVCSVSATTSDGRVRGSFSCSNLRRYDYVLWNIGTAKHSAYGTFNCLLQK